MPAHPPKSEPRIDTFKKHVPAYLVTAILSFRWRNLEARRSVCTGAAGRDCRRRGFGRRHGKLRSTCAFRVLTISERGFYELTTTEEEGAIAPCFDEDSDSAVLFGDPNYGDVPPAFGGFAQLFTGDQGKSVLELVPGRYELVVGHAGHETRTAELTVRAAPGPIPQTPESAE